MAAGFRGDPKISSTAADIVGCKLDNSDVRR